MFKSVIFALLFFVYLTVHPQYIQVEHRELVEGEIGINAPGSFSEAGAVYVLENDISSEKSAIFLGKDITLDLNGYSIKFADANYGSILNSGFEQGVLGWDLSKAPGAKILNTSDSHVFLGDKLMSLQAGDEITSSYVYLPVENRSYFAICGITGRYYSDMKNYPDDEMKVSVFVEDEFGNEVSQQIEYGDGSKQGVPVENKSPRLGGGFVYAHLTNLPVGKYRVRIRADTDCFVDEIDIRPAMDIGIGIIEKTNPLAHFDHVISESRPPIIPSFFDFTGNMTTGAPIDTLPQVHGEGTITIKNGIIESDGMGLLSWGIQSSSKDVKVILDNVNIKTGGISSGAAMIPNTEIQNCRFDVDMPFLIQRHVSLCSVVIWGKNPVNISNSEFYGGQGCLSVKGKNSLIHDNIFVNNQTVTNHYSIMGTGEGSKIYNNRFEPKQGSGIYVSRHTEVYNNFFSIETSPPTCEYGREEYSTAAIRLGDYNAVPGSPNAAVGIKIHSNKIIINAKNHESPDSYIPMAWGIFYSARGGENYVYNNEFVVNNHDPESKVKAAALYISGGLKYFGGQFYNNQITTNVPAAWIATIYGGASKSKLYNNTIIPLNDAKFKTFVIGDENRANNVAQNVEFNSNIVKGGEFDIGATDHDHSYSVSWTLKITVKNKEGVFQKNTPVKIRNKFDEIIFNGSTDVNGSVTTELQEYAVDKKMRSIKTPYTIYVKDERKIVNLESNKDIALTIR